MFACFGNWCNMCNFPLIRQFAKPYGGVKQVRYTSGAVVAIAANAIATDILTCMPYHLWLYEGRLRLDCDSVYTHLAGLLCHDDPSSQYHAHAKCIQLQLAT